MNLDGGAEEAAVGGGAEAMATRASSMSTDDALTRQWERFFKDRMKPQINDAAIGWPQRRSVTVDFRELDRYAHDLAEEMLRNPTQSLRVAEEALKTVDVAVDIGGLPGLSTVREKAPRLRVRVEGLHVEGGRDHATVTVRDLRAEHLGRLLAVKGLVRRATDVRPQISAASFRCRRCNALILEPQDEHLVLREPVECYEDQGGCGAAGSFKLVTDPNEGNASRFTDTQKLEIEEAPEGLRGGEQPQRLVAWVDDDLCGKVAPGDRIVLTGVLRAHVRKVGGVKSTRMDIHLEVAGVASERKEYEDIEISPEEEAEILRMSKAPDLYERMRQSIAADIHGLDTEKEALLLQLFGGLPKRLKNGGRLRGDMHILFVGDPGVAKSQLIRTVARLAPRGIYTSGQSTSAAGLTAAAVQDEGFGEGRWTLEAGAMVLADKGLCAIDEVDKMDKRDRSAMHEALEQQTVSVAKAGITATLQSRCSVVGAANPKNGRFDEFSPFAEQIDLPPALLSRFDLIFVLTDKPDAGRDAALATAILDVHRGNAMRELLDAKPEAAIDPEDMAQALRTSAPLVDRELLRKYVAYAKRTCFPVLSKEAQEYIREYYVNIRRSANRPDDDSKAPIPLTARQLEAFVRLSEASAKIRLSDTVTLEDAQRAVSIVERYVRRLNRNEGGIMDIDSIATGTSASARDRIRILTEIIRELSVLDERYRAAAFADIVEKAEQRGIPVDKTRELINKMRTSGQVIEAATDRFRIVRES